MPRVRARERHHEARRLLAEGTNNGVVKQATGQDFETAARAWYAHWKADRNQRYAGYVTEIQAVLPENPDNHRRTCPRKESDCFMNKMLSGLAVAATLYLTGCATADVVPMGTDTYMISQTSAGGVFTNMGALKSKVMARANEFAGSKGKVAIPVAARESPAYPGHMPNFEYQFRLVDKNDPRATGAGLVKTPDVVIENRGQQSPAVIVNNGTEGKSKDVYSELIKLDDLRKKGIISESEFSTQKQRLLEGK